MGKLQWLPDCLPLLPQDSGGVLQKVQGILSIRKQKAKSLITYYRLVWFFLYLFISVIPTDFSWSYMHNPINRKVVCCKIQDLLPLKFLEVLP